MKKPTIIVWAYELCACKYETGYSVRSLHTTKEKATKAMNTDKKKHSGHLYDGYRVVEWTVN